jgi:tetratricopeptide (TPR) repeat protein
VLAVSLAIVGAVGAAWLLERRQSHARRDLTASSGKADEFADWFEASTHVELQSTGRPAHGLDDLQTASWERETDDPAAYELYLKSKRLIEGAVLSSGFADALEAAAAMLTQATERDPEYAAAFYQLAHAHDQLYLRYDRTPKRRALGRNAIETLRRLRPNAGQTHLAMAKHLYWAWDDYPRAREKLELAIRLLPNDPTAPLLLAYVFRREGRWEESTGNFLRAAALDPSNASPLQQLSLNYFNLRRFREMAETMDRVIELAPHDLTFRAQRAAIELHWHADTRPVHRAINEALGPKTKAGPELIFNWFDLAMHERDGVAARNVVALMPAEGCHFVDVPFPRSWCGGMAARLRNDNRAAKVEFRRARDEALQFTTEFPSRAGGFTALGMAEAALGNKEAALRAGRKAVELEPISRDALDGPVFVGLLGVIYSWTGEMDLAVQQVEAATSVPSFWSYGTLKLHPYWDSLRDDFRFQQILERLAPKD